MPLTKFTVAAPFVTPVPASGMFVVPFQSQSVAAPL